MRVHRLHRLVVDVRPPQDNYAILKMYRRELNYCDLQQRGIGDVERYPVSEALASIEGAAVTGKRVR